MAVNMTVDVANRLYALKHHIGFPDFYRLTEHVVKIAEEAFVNYPGWDKDELAARSIAFRSAKKFQSTLMLLMDNAIAEGIEAARQGIEDGGELEADYLRVAVERGEQDKFDGRIQGSY